MQFKVCDKSDPTKPSCDVFWLQRDNWDDFSFKTAFKTYYYDSAGKQHELGFLRIGYAGMTIGRVFDIMPREFTILPKEYFSLGLEEYYQKIADLGREKRETILSALRDVAYDLSVFELFKAETVMTTSLLRDYSEFTVRSQLHRMALGGARLTKYSFRYRSLPSNEDVAYSRLSIDFNVQPESNPPTNIHVLIGRNGTGKTYLLQNMMRSILCEGPLVNSIESHNAYGSFEYEPDEYNLQGNCFANILCIAFSPFDDFSSISQGEISIPYTYIGLDKQAPNLLKNVSQMFLESFDHCMLSEGKKERWIETVSILKSDPAFATLSIETLLCKCGDDVSARCNLSVKDDMARMFDSLSSGHKVALLIITNCVDKLEEKSIVFIDEPENHLHPPLLSAFIRAFSSLLSNRNGVAIVSTHSPVVLQEVPRSCVWALRRQGNQRHAERLSIETFGSSIGLLTSEVFGLEVEKSGFHKLLSDAVDELGDYNAIMEKFNNQLGDEARGILRVMLATRESGRKER